ncbi:anthranilate phosphoribosyltransferase [Sporomusaceae bacterium FL31]|nr:anthranilate phosphoribosyltransferase [Sporomusaceae bacterium FL31]GCE35226.1 anthranilate phosphoribosyltransferase [Sporomusaceae bacterium]
MLKEYLHQVLSGQHLTRQQAGEAMNVIMSGQASEAQIGSFLTALKLKGETSSEITGFAETMRSHAESIVCRQSRLIDTCGTGGDCKGTFNVSTTVAFVLAGAGLAVAKHGNRSVSSSCGSADVLAALGVNVELAPQTAADAIDEINVGFLFAPIFHKAMKYAAKPRKDLGFRTVFNILGPLSNPAKANYQLIGVYDQDLTEKVAGALLGLGVERAMVVHSFDGLDEISTTEPTQVTEVRDGQLSSYVINPQDYGFSAAAPDDYLGGTAEQNAEIILKILQGQRGPKRDIVLINAAAALYIAGSVPDLHTGLELAAASIDSGKAYAKLHDLKNFSHRLREEALLS